MRKFLTSFWGMFAVLFALVLMGANTPLLIKGVQQASWVQFVRLVTPWSQTTELPNQRVRIETGNTNWLENPSFEDASATAWGTSGSPSVSLITNPASNYIEEGDQALQFSTNSSGQYVQNCVPARLSQAGKSIEFSIKANASAASRQEVCSVVGSTEVQCVPVPSVSGPGVMVTATAVADGASQLCIRVKAISASTTITILDDAYLGPNRNIGTVAQAELVGTLKYAATTNCQWSRTSSTIGGFSADTDCPTPVVTGSVKAPSTKIPAVVLSNPNGHYRFVAKGNFAGTTTGGQTSFWRFSDGTNVSEPITQYQSNSVEGFGEYTGLISYSGQSGDVTIEMQAARTGNTNFITATDATHAVGLVIEVWRVPSQAEQVLRMNCSGAACGTNNFSATVSTAGAITKQNVPWLASASYVSGGNYTITFNTSNFSLAPNCGCTIINSGAAVEQSCTVHTITSSGAQVYTTSNNAASASRDFSIFCERVGSDRVAANMPLIKGGVTSGYAGVARVEWALMTSSGCSSNPCTISAQSGVFTSMGRGSTGVYTLNYPSSTWSSAPICTCSAYRAGGVGGACLAGSSSTTVFNFETARIDTAALADSQNVVSIMCVGPR